MASQPAFAALALPDGTRYEGPVVDGVLTGASATYDHPDGSRYTGAVEAGLRHGRGVLTAPGGTAVYDGDWVHGKREGQVRAIEGWEQRPEAPPTCCWWVAAGRVRSSC